MSSTEFVFFGLIGKTRWPPWPIPQKGDTLYSGARYVALRASCFTFRDGTFIFGICIVMTRPFGQQHQFDREQRWPSDKALGLRSKRTGVRFPASPLEFSEIGYLLLPSRDMAERSLN